MNGLMILVLAVTTATAGGPWGMPVNADGECEYAGVVEVGGATAGDLYAKASAWAGAFEGTIEVTEDAGVLTLRAEVPAPLIADVRFTITIETKDGRYRYRFSDFSLDIGSGVHRDLNPGGKKYRGKRGAADRTDRKIQRVLEGLHMAMATGAGDDW